MISGKQGGGGAWRLPVFPMACWALAMMAFTQLLVAGMALATRLEESKQVRVIEKEVLKPVVVRVPTAGHAAAPPVVSRPPVPPVAETPQFPASPIQTPQVADPRSERLLNEAREAIVSGDMGRAIVKLEEALGKSPEDPNVHFELGRVHEQMGVFDTAAAHYEKVFQMGVEGAGTLYGMAAAKLRDGFEKPDAMLGKLSLGRVRIFNDPNHETGQRVILTIPVQKAPADEVDVGEIEVSVNFFNRTTKGEIVPRENEPSTEQWVTMPFEWAGGEESLRITYTVPPQDHQTEHLFGARSYYGQVVSLKYKGEVLDVQAWPRDLAARISKQPATAPGEMPPPEFLDALPPDLGPGVLPPLPEP